MTQSEATKPLTAPAMAHQLFEAAVVQHKGDDAQASMSVINFLREALVYAIVMSAADEPSCKTLLQYIGDSITNAPTKPPPPGGASK